jgi:hypothetical protein
VIALVVAVAAAPLPVMAGESQQPASSTPGIRASVARAVDGETRAVTAHARTVRAAQTQADLGSPSFFKTPAGLVTLVAVAAGLGFALYSTSNDRVKSPNRDYGGGK